MRNLKSMVAFLVVAAMLFASVTSFAYGDVAADADYATAVEVLSALEILKGDDKGNFNPDNTITRAESAAVIVRLLGLEEAAAGAAGATQFVDVAADHWGSGYINMAAQSGIIAGYGDGNFGPEDAVTYEQFVKMLVCALGYEPKALTKGTYPTGYLIAAKEMKLTKGVSGSAGQEAARSVVAQLGFNALDIPLMEQDGWGSEVKYEIRDVEYNDAETKVKTEAITLLSEKLEVYKVNGKVTTADKADEIAFTVTELCDTNADIKAEKQNVYTNGIVVTGLLEYPATAYLKKADKSGWYDLVAISKDLDIETITLSGADVIIEGGKLTYKDEDGDKVDPIDYASATVYTNGEKTSIADVKKDSSFEYILVMDKDVEDKVATIFATEYTAAVVDKYDAARERIVLKKYTAGLSKYIDLDEDALKNKTYSLVDANGAEVALEDLKEDDVLTIVNGKTAIEMVVSDATVEGKVTASVKDKETKEDIYTIGGEKYVLGAAFAALTEDGVGLKSEGTFYLDVTGKIVKFVKAEATSNLVFIYKVKANTEGKTVSVLDKDGLNTYKLLDEEEVVFNQDGDKKDGDKITLSVIDLFDDDKLIESEIKAGFYVLEADAEGVITTLYPANERKDDEGNAIESFKTAIATENEYVADQAKLGSKFLADDVLIFNVNKDVEEKSAISVSDLASLVDQKKYTAYMLDSNTDGEVTVMALTTGAADAALEAPIAIVTAIVDTLDDEDKPVKELTLLSEGKEVVVLADSLKNNAETVTIAEGSVITYIVDGDGKLDTFKEIATVKAVKKDNDIIDIGADAAKADAAEDNRIYVYGTVKEITSKGIATIIVDTANSTLLDKEGNKLASTTIKLVEGADAYVVESDGEVLEFAVADAFDLAENAPDADKVTYLDEAHYVFFALDEDGAIVSMIIVDPLKGAYEDLGLGVVKA